MNTCANVSKKAGFTLVELLISIAIIVLVVGIFGFGIIGSICMGNQWFSESGVLREIKNQNPKAVEITSIKSHVFSKSEVTVKNSDDTRQVYLLDSDVLRNYSLTLKQ